MQTERATAADFEIGARIRQKRRELRVSQTALANAIGVTFQQVQKYENGNNRITASRLHQVAGVLQTPLSWFFAGPDGSGDLAELLGEMPELELVARFPADMRASLASVIRAMASTDAMKSAFSAMRTTAEAVDGQRAA